MNSLNLTFGYAFDVQRNTNLICRVEFAFRSDIQDVKEIYIVKKFDIFIASNH